MQLQTGERAGHCPLQEVREGNGVSHQEATCHTQRTKTAVHLTVSSSTVMDNYYSVFYLLEFFYNFLRWPVVRGCAGTRELSRVWRGRGPVWSELSTANLGQEQKLQDRHKHFFYTHFDGLTSVFFTLMCLRVMYMTIVHLAQCLIL